MKPHDLLTILLMMSLSDDKLEKLKTLKTDEEIKADNAEPKTIQYYNIVRDRKTEGDREKPRERYPGKPGGKCKVHVSEGNAYRALILMNKFQCYF